MDQPKTGQNATTGLIGGAFGLAKNLLGLIISRLELAALEFSEIGGNLLKIVVLFALALMAGWCWKILLLMALIFTALSAALALYVRSVLGEGKIALPETMAELRKDRDALL